MKSRNHAIDLLRIILMGGICYLHAAGGYADIPTSAWLAKLLFPCVPCFVFISGYYGISFKPIKLLRLYLLAYFCAFISECILATINSVDWNAIKLAQGALSVSATRYWFLNSYFFLCFCSSIINVAVRETTPFERIVPFLVLVFGWGFLLTVPYAKDIFPRVSGFEPMSGLTLVGIYVFARCFRVYDWESNLKSIYCVCAIPILGICAIVGFNDYNSPTGVLLAACIFTLFKRHIHVAERLQGVVDLLGGAMLAVYLLHFSPAGEFFMRKIGGILVQHKVPDHMAYICVAVTVFTGSTFIELIRRKCVLALRVALGKMFGGQAHAR